MIAGIDEAGRGSVIGPLVLALVKGDGFEGKGFVDSKEIPPERREELYDRIISEYEVFTEIVPASTLNDMMGRMSLNEIEAVYAARMIQKAKPRRVYVDSPDTMAGRFAQRIRTYLQDDVEIIAEHKADANYPVVSAASIVAKVVRDREIERIKERLGLRFSSGYPSDETTVEAVRRILETKRGLEYVRIRWATVDNLRQRGLRDFL